MYKPSLTYDLTVFIREGHESEITEAVKREIRDMSPLDLNLTPLI